MELNAALIFIAICCINHAKSESKDLISATIAGLFNQETSYKSMLVFQKIVELKKENAYHGDAIYSKDITDGYTLALEVCSKTLGDNAVIAMIDARSTVGDFDATSLLCNKYQIPHLYLGWQLPDLMNDNVFTFSFYPPTELISKAFVALIKDLQWDKFTILYEQDDGFIRLREIVTTWPTTKEPIVYRKLDPNGDNRETFKEIFKVSRMSYHVLDCEAKHVEKYMHEIVQVENSTQYQSFILTSLDAYMLDLKDIPNLKANLSTLHVTTSNDIRWKDIGMAQDKIELETALTADALAHLEKALRMIAENPDDDFSNITELPVPSLCLDNEGSSPWEGGFSLQKSILKTQTEGFTGNIVFDDYGKRTNLNMYYSKLNNESQFAYAGKWNSFTNKIDYDYSTPQTFLAQRSNFVLRVASIKNPPYLFMDEVNGTVEYTGYAVSLMEAIVKQIKKNNGTDYKYEFYKVNSYGNSVEGSKKWNGMIGDLQEHKADLAICDLTITAERNDAVDFSIPFMTLGISMLFKKPESEPPNKFSFINPLAFDVWMYLVTFYIIVSFTLLICARTSEDDWVNPHPCNQNPENLQNIWTLYNCMWLTMGSIMTQGCDILPRAASSRWITGFWWFFALIITASYTANMSTFLSYSRRDNEIKDVVDLSNQKDISYGALYNASTYKFFEKTNDSVYSKIWSVMKEARPTVFTKSNEEGKDRVLRSKGKYVFFMESTAIEYFTQRNCELKMVGGTLDSKEYGIAFPKKSFLKGLIDEAILSLQESGELDKLKVEWWNKDSANCAELEKENEEDDNGSLQMKNTSGIFMVLGFGGFLGLIVAIIEFLMHANEIAGKERITFKEAVISEWRASLDPRVLQKPAVPLRSRAPSLASRSPSRERSRSRAVSVIKAATSFINFDEIY